MKQVHTQVATDPETLRISIDTKAKVKIGDFSRDGEARGAEAVQALDHDMHPTAVLAPAGILEVDTRQLNVVFGTSRDTSDFVADCLDDFCAHSSALFAQLAGANANNNNNNNNKKTATDTTTHTIAHTKHLPSAAPQPAKAHAR